MRKIPTHGSLFSGIGGFDLASEWMGWENIFHCEWNDFGKRILNYYWPNAISYDDITKTDFTIHRGKIDILTGGFPCQPYSVAGKRKGKEDDRHLWPEMLRAIREIQPTYVVGENVRGLINWNGGMVFDEVQTDLENEGYEITPFLLPAGGVNAPHRRDRIWFVAFKNPDQNGRRSDEWEKESDFRKQRNFSAGNNERISTDNGKTRYVANTRIERCNNGRDNRQERHLQNDIRTTEENKSERNGWKCGACEIGSISTDTSNQGLQRSEKHRSLREGRKDRNQSFTGCVPSNWEKFPTQAPICDGDDGLSSRLDAITFPKWRTESVKAGGNAIVPQVALQIFKAIELHNEKINLK